jgi:hypothetical protein
MQPDEYARSGEALEAAAEESRREILAPVYSRPGATGKELGESIAFIRDNTQKLVKKRTGPVFDRARNQGFKADASAVRAEATAELQRDRLAAESMNPGERALLQKLLATEPPRTDLVRNPDGSLSANVVEDFRFPLDDPGGILDFISRNKARMREMTPEGAPTEGFVRVLERINEAAEKAYQDAALKAGKGGVYQKLMQARADYNDMMGTVFDDDIVKAIRAKPERLGELVTAKGNVSEIDELDRLLALAEREGAAEPLETALVHNELTKGFLEQHVNSLEKAAKWSETLGKDRKLERTWRALTKDDKAANAEKLMKLLEKQAQIVMRDNPARANAQLVRFGSPAGAAGAGFWMGGLPGAMYGMALGWNVGKMAKMIALSQTKGSGVLPKDVALAIRATTPGFAGGRAAVEAIERLREAARNNGLGELVEAEESTATQPAGDENAR